MWSIETLEWIDIELTSFCNIKCKGCFREQTQHKELLNKEYITLETIKEKFVKEYFPSIKIINFCGSIDEPTSHPQFFEIVKHFADWNAHINIATNGSTRTVSWWKDLASILPKSHAVTWGIDGSDELSEVYRVGSNFKKVKQNYKAFIEAGGKAVWQFIEFEHNQHQTEAARQKAVDEGFKKFTTIISHRKDTKGIVHKKQEVDELLTIECKYLKQNRIFVNHLGDVIPCCHLNAKSLNYNVTKNIEDRFEEILSQGNNLKDKTLEQSITGSVFTDIANSWNSDNKIPRCVQACKQNKRDTFNKERLK